MWNAISDTPVSWFGLKMFNLQSTISHVIEIAPDAYKINVEPDRCVKKKNESRNWTNFRQYQQFDYPLYQFPCRYVSTISPFILCIFCYKYIPVHIEGRPKSEKVPPIPDLWGPIPCWRQRYSLLIVTCWMVNILRLTPVNSFDYLPLVAKIQQHMSLPWTIIWLKFKDMYHLFLGFC